MVNSLIISGGQSLYAQSTTQSFVPLGLGYNGATPNTTEADTQITHRTAGTLSKLSTNCTTHTNNTVISLHKNASATGINQTITITATGVTTDSTHTDAVAAADKWNYVLSNLASTFSNFSCVFAATTDTSCRLVTFAPGGNLTGGAATNYHTLMGQASVTTTLANGEITLEKAGTLKFLALNLNANNSTPGATKVRTAKGGTPTIGNCSITTTGLGAGIVEDTSHSDTVTAGDLWTMQLSIAIGDTLGYTSVAIDYITTTGDSIQGNGKGAASGGAKSLTRVYCVGGDFLFQTNAEAGFEVTTQDTYLYSNFFCNCSTFISADTVNFRTAATTNQIAITTAGTGQQGNTINTYAALATDLITFQIATGSTTGNRFFTAVWIHANLATAAAANIYPRSFSTKSPEQLTLPIFYPGPSNLSPMFTT